MKQHTPWGVWQVFADGSEQLVARFDDEQAAADFIRSAAPPDTGTLEIQPLCFVDADGRK